MNRTARAWRRAVLPASVFALVFAAHCAVLGLFPEQNPAQTRWAPVATSTASAMQRYAETQQYWLGFSYALSLAFAAVALRRYREERFCYARNLAIGGVTLSGFLAVAGCYLVGCCGSPMLAVYLTLLGPRFLPLAKPLIAAVTAISIGAAWWWMERRRPSAQIGRACSITN